MDDRRWGFEEAEEWEYGAPKKEASPPGDPDPENTLVGRDADQVVEVIVTPDAAVVAVRRGPGLCGT